MAIIRSNTQTVSPAADAKTSEATLLVEAIGQFGIKADGQWYGLEGVGSEKFKVGSSYEVALRTYSTGKIAVTSVGGPKLDKATPIESLAKSKAPAPRLQAGGTDWAAKDRSQLVGGRSHDAVELVKAHVNSMKPMSELLALYKEALDGILKVAEEIK